MKIVTAVMAHGHPSLALDTVESVQRFIGPAVIVVDRVSWNNFKAQHILVDGLIRTNYEPPCPIFKGLHHGVHRSNYRNYCYALKILRNLYPDANWFCYLEQDVLVTNRVELNTDAWMLGSNLRDPHNNWDKNPFEEIVGIPLKNCAYMLGCCHFINKHFMEKLLELNILDKILEATSHYHPGDMPGYPHYAFEEDMLPTICNALDGKLENLEWHERYLLRFRPEIADWEVTLDALMIHPSKHSKDKIRIMQKRRRSITFL